MFGLFGGGGHKDGEWKYDDIPTPANDDEIRAITDKTLESAVKLFKGTEGDGWKVVKEDSGIKLDEFPSSSGAFCTRVRGQIDGVNPKTLADLFYAGSVQDKQRYHPELHQQKIVREIDPNLRIMKTVFQQTGISNREFIAIRALREYEGGWAMVSTSINVESEPFEKGNVRGVVVISAAFFQAVDGNDKATLLTSIDQIDAKGSIPGFVLSMAKAKPLDRVKAIRGIYA